MWAAIAESFTSAGCHANCRVVKQADSYEPVNKEHEPSSLLK
jgi:hypothetical protein